MVGSLRLSTRAELAATAASVLAFGLSLGYLAWLGPPMPGALPTLDSILAACTFAASVFAIIGIIVWPRAVKRVRRRLADRRQGRRAAEAAERRRLKRERHSHHRPPSKSHRP